MARRAKLPVDGLCELALRTALSGAQESVKRRAGRKPIPPAARADEALFYSACAKLLRGYAQSNLAPSQRRDFVQAAMVRIAVDLKDFSYQPDRGPLCAWVFSMAHRECADEARHEARRPDKPAPRHAPPDLQQHVVLDADADPFREAVRHERGELVHLALDKLKPRVRPIDFQVLILLDIEERSVEEVCNALHLSPEEVWDRHRRMTDKLRPILRQLFGRKNDPNE